MCRSKTLQFSIAQSSLHYFRTHFSEDQCWLQLIIKESGQYYQIFSWKGTVYGFIPRILLKKSLLVLTTTTGDSKGSIFGSICALTARAHQVEDTQCTSCLWRSKSHATLNLMALTTTIYNYKDFANTEILSRKEVNLIHPFTHRLKVKSPLSPSKALPWESHWIQIGALEYGYSGRGIECLRVCAVRRGHTYPRLRQLLQTLQPQESSGEGSSQPSEAVVGSRQHNKFCYLYIFEMSSIYYIILKKVVVCLRWSSILTTKMAPL